MASEFEKLADILFNGKSPRLQQERQAAFEQGVEKGFHLARWAAELKLLRLGHLELAQSIAGLKLEKKK